MVRKHRSGPLAGHAYGTSIHKIDIFSAQGHYTGTFAPRRRHAPQVAALMQDLLAEVMLLHTRRVQAALPLRLQTA